MILRSLERISDTTAGGVPPGTAEAAEIIAMVGRALNPNWRRLAPNEPVPRPHYACVDCGQAIPRNRSWRPRCLRCLDEHDASLRRGRIRPA